MAPTRKNILMLCSWYPNRVQPANGNFVEKHVRLVAEVHQVQVLQVEYDPALGHQCTEWVATKEDNYQLLTVYFGCDSSKWQRLWIRLSLFQKAFHKWHSTENRFDWVHAQVAMPAVLVARYWYTRYSLPFVLTCHSSGFLPISPKQYPFWQRRMLISCANAARVVSPVSQALVEAWQANGLRAPVCVIPNVVDTALFYPATTPPAYPHLKLLHISNFHPQAKNVEGLLRVAKRLIEQGCPFQLTIAGDGDLARIQAYAQKLEFPSTQVILLGSLTESAVAEMMRTNHVFVLFSNYETQGVTLLEAQCCGLSVIATRVGGIPEIVDEDWKGVLVESGDEVALAQVIVTQAAELTKMVDAAKISTSAHARYSREAVRNRLIELYNYA